MNYVNIPTDARNWVFVLLKIEQGTKHNVDMENIRKTFHNFTK